MFVLWSCQDWVYLLMLFKLWWSSWEQSCNFYFIQFNSKVLYWSKKEIKYWYCSYWWIFQGVFVDHDGRGQEGPPVAVSVAAILKNCPCENLVLSEICFIVYIYGLHFFVLFFQYIYYSKYDHFWLQLYFSQCQHVYFF